MLLLTLTTIASAATPFAGVAWQPLGRNDLVWVDEDRTTGDAVGEFDGVVNPGLQAFGGAWLGDRWGLAGSLGIARLTTTQWVGDVYRTRHWGVFRPALDLRMGLGPREVHRPAAWLMLGLHGDIPSARDVSNGYTADEEQVADEGANAERLRLGGFGGRVGAGVDYRLTDGIAVGLTYAVGAHWGVLRSSEASTLSSWVASEAALTATFEWRSGD